MPAHTPLCCRFNFLLDQHLLSWLEEYPWTKMEIALTWLTLLWQQYDNSVRPPWWHHMSSSSSNNPGISWLWNFCLKTTSQQQSQFVHFLTSFLQCPKRCRHLSVGNASTTNQFARICVQIVLNSCLGSTDSLNLRYLSFLFVEHTDDMCVQDIFTAFMSCCQCF